MKCDMCHDRGESEKALPQRDTSEEARDVAGWMSGVENGPCCGPGTM